MKTFTDSTGRAWSIAVNVASIKRVRGMAGVDLLSILETDLLGKLSSDPVLLVDVLYSLVKPEADAAGVSDEDFGRALVGDAIDTATTALLEDLVDFFPSDRRALMRKAMEKLKTLHTMAYRAVTVKMESGELEKRMAAALLELDEPGDTSTSSPALSASTPAR